jgi:hypothetical protein
MSTNNLFRQKSKSKSRHPVLEISTGRFVMREGAPMPPCHVCDRPAPAWSWPGGEVAQAHSCAIINAVILPLCQDCFVAGNSTMECIAREFFNAPDMAFTEGGDADPDTVRAIGKAIAEKRDATSH